MRHRPTWALVLLVAVLAASCGGSSPAPQQAQSGSTPEAAQPDGSRSPRVNRILVLDGNAAVFTVRPDGTDRTDLTVADSTSVQASQPVWSPNADRVAWVETQLSRPARTAVITSRVDGSGRTAAVTISPAFYLGWDPTGARVAYLAVATNGLELGVVDVAAGGDEAVRLANGQPFYFAWAPDGLRLFSHIGAYLLAVLPVDGPQTTLPDRGGIFRAPQWDPDSGRLLYSARTTDAQQLVLVDPDGNDRQVLLEFDGFIEFALSPDGRYLAYQVASTPSQDDEQDSGQFELAFSQQPPQAFPDALVVIDRASGRATQIRGAPALAFFWSPDGRRLLYLLPDRREGRLLLRWLVWDGTSSVELAAFLPTREFSQNYLPFFDQFAQTVSPWAPDSRRIVYAGANDQGESGVWVQTVDGAAPPTRIATGEVAFWSPR